MKLYLKNGKFLWEELFIMKKFLRILRFFIIFAIVLVIAVVLSNTIYSIVLNKLQRRKIAYKKDLFGIRASPLIFIKYLYIVLIFRVFMMSFRYSYDVL